jgi:hypothetical protein
MDLHYLVIGESSFLGYAGTQFYQTQNDAVTVNRTEPNRNRGYFSKTEPKPCFET